MKYIPSIIIVALTALVLTSIGYSRTGQASSSAEVESSLDFACAQVPATGFELSHIEATRRIMRSAGKQYPAMIVLMANYDRLGGSYHPNAQGDDQRRVLLNFSAAAGQELAPGRYSLDSNMGEGNRLSIGVEGGNGSCGLSDGEGYGEITRIDDSTVEGHVKVWDSKGTRVEASFSTSYSASRY